MSAIKKTVDLGVQKALEEKKEAAKKETDLKNINKEEDAKA